MDKNSIIIISDDANIDIQQIFEYIKLNSIYYAVKTKENIGEKIIRLGFVAIYGQESTRV